MPIHNSDIARILNDVADLLDIQGENEFRIRAYRNAARNISSVSQNISEMVKNGDDLTRLHGIGKNMAEKIEEIVKTGSLSQLKELEKKIPGDLRDLMKIPALGPKRVALLYKELDIKSLEELKEAAQNGRVKGIKGLGEKTEKTILEEIERIQKGKVERRILLSECEQIAKPLLEYLKNIEGVNKVEAAGSYRRKKETIGDLDILITCKDDSRVMEVMDSFLRYEDVERVLAKGETKSSVVFRNEFHVDLRVLPQDCYGAALMYFTGSKAHNVEIRKLGQQKGLKISEYGAFRGDERVAGVTEEEIYSLIGLSYIPPELRENSGEIEAAKEGKLPNLIKLEDIKGDLQSHTTESDGKNTLEEMAYAAFERGYRYLGITDHSKKVTVAHGLDEKRLAKQIEEIEKLNQRIKGILILKSIEVDILEDGSLDLPNEILKELDIVVCSIHYNFKLSRDKQTERMLKAMENPYAHIIGHPTGRIIGAREPYDVDLERVMKGAKQTGCHLEINAQPDRLDLADIYIKQARDMGLKFAISTDAHATTHLDFMHFGVAQARRGWLEPEDVLNTRSWDDLKKLLRR